MTIDSDFVRSLPVGVRHVGDNLAIPKPSEEALRTKRFLLLRGAQDVVWPFWISKDKIDQETGEILKRRRSEFRVSCCLRTPVDDEVRIWRGAGGSVGYGGLMRCGHIWGCPICCAKVMRVREEQISGLFKGVLADGGAAVMVTFTARHHLDDSLADLLGAFKDAQQSMKSSRAFRHLVEGCNGRVVVTEIKWSPDNGWHPHQHQAWFFPFKPGPDPEQLAASLFPIWRHHCKKHGLETIEYWRDRRIGVDVRPAWDASEYLAKFDREREWSLPAEVTAGRLKTGNSDSLTPWGILEDAILRGRDSKAAGLWIEYLRAVKWKACVSLKPAEDLCELYGIPMAVDDFKDANKLGEAEDLCTLSAQSFDAVCRAGGLGNLLEAARKGGLPGVDMALQKICQGEHFFVDNFANVKYSLVMPFGID